MLVAALGCGLVAEAFFAFSAFVMKILARLLPSEGIAAMQRRRHECMVMVAFFGTPRLASSR